MLCNVTNILHRNTKQPLPLFFVDSEPDINNKDVFKIDYLYYTKVKIEEPRTINQLIQFLCCQGFSHTKSYCNHHPKCVHCEDSPPQKAAKNLPTNQLHAHYVMETTRSITETVLCSKKFKLFTILRNLTQCIIA
jgi:hypothetical protein